MNKKVLHFDSIYSGEYAIQELNLLSSRFLANEVMEDWNFEITEIDTFPAGTRND